MSALVNSQGSGLAPQNDDGACPVDYRANPPLWSASEFRDADWQWPRAQAFGAFGGAGALLNGDPAAQAWEWNVYATGGRRRKVFTGQTLNAAGAPLGGCTVTLFNTATGQIVDSTTSDAGGNYKLTDPNNVACFVVAYLVGSPDVTGATINELTGS